MLKHVNNIFSAGYSSSLACVLHLIMYGFLGGPTYGQTPKIVQADIIVYGGTSAGVAAAVTAARLGKSVILVSPDVHLGGLSSAGLGFTDTGNKEVIGGLAREFYHRVYLHYQSDTAWRWQKKTAYGNKGQGTPAIDGKDRTMWIFEPHVAEKIMEDLIREHKVTVYRNEWLNRDTDVEMKGGKICGITTISGRQFKAKVFIDASYEGDLMAAAKVSYHVGREANRVYGEQWNGVQTGTFHHKHHFTSGIDPYRIKGNRNSGLLDGISGEHPGVKGEGDNKLQAYCFRMCLTNLPENKVTFPKPDHYNPERYELLLRLFEGGWNELFEKYDAIPNRKTDTNNHGPFSTDYIGMNYAYPEASYESRRQIIKNHENYQKGLLYFMANDLRMPPRIQNEVRKWGLAKDEFKDNGNWPYQLYVREARRMRSDYVMTEHEVLGKKQVPNSIGMGSYALDSHHTQRYVTPDGFVQNEGDIGVKAPKPYAIAYDAIVPKLGECTNLLVPVCLSASHIAYGSVRMEPVFMILGESAATAAVLAVRGNIPVQKVSYDQLKRLLLKQRQRLEQPPSVQLFAARPGTAKIFSYPLPSIYKSSSVFDLNVNGVSVPVVSYNDKYDYAHLSMSKGKAEITISLKNGENVSAWHVSPKKLSIKGVPVRNELRFTLHRDEYLIVKINQLRELVIAADAEELNKPSPTGKGIFNISSQPYSVLSSRTTLATSAIQRAIDDASVFEGGKGIVYVPAGVYPVRNLKLKSNMNLYLEGGAVLLFSGEEKDFKISARKASQNRNITWWIATDSGAHDIKVYGRGTLDGNGKYSTEKHNLGNHILAIMHSERFELNGPIIRESGAWAIIPTRSKNLVFQNFKLFNRFDMGENDGIDVIESQNVLVKHAIGIALDDPFSTKTWKQNTDLCRNWPGKPMVQDGVVFEDCISWTYCYGYKIGQGVMQDQRNIIFKDCVVYDAAVGIGIHHKWGTASVKNVLFDGIDIERLSYQNDDHRTWAIFLMQNGDKLGSGPISDVLVKNIRVRDAGKSPGKIRGLSAENSIKNLQFKNIMMPGMVNPGISLDQINMTDTIHVNQIQIRN